MKHLIHTIMLMLTAAAQDFEVDGTYYNITEIVPLVTISHAALPKSVKKSCFNSTQQCAEYQRFVLIVNFVFQMSASIVMGN